MRTTRRKLAHHRNRATQLAGHRGRESWRKAPATRDQLAALRLIATSTGHTFRVGVTRGEAWRRIKQATALLDEPARSRCAPPWHATKRQEVDHAAA